jgi:hypothetical protein
MNIYSPPSIMRFLCQGCDESFMGSPYQNAFCGKCGSPHILCDACWNLHRISAAQADRYLNQLEEELK